MRGVASARVVRREPLGTLVPPGRARRTGLARPSGSEGTVEKPTVHGTRVHVPGNVRSGTELVGGRLAMVVRSTPGRNRGALGYEDGMTIAEAARSALDRRIPLVLVLASSGADVVNGIDAMHGWGVAAAGMARCSGIVPVLAAVTGPAISGIALMLGLADVVAMTPEAFAFVSGPDMVLEFTGIGLERVELGGTSVHATSTGICALPATDGDHAMALLADVISYLPAHTDEAPPFIPTDDPPDRQTPELSEVVPTERTASYDVRDVAESIVDDSELIELRARWAPQIVTALGSVGGRPVGIVANQPRALAGTLDIAASQKAARFVRMCDSFNLPIITLVDTPGFLPGKDLEWRGMIRHGAELAFAYAEATVPRVCLILRKAYGGAYIVLDSKGVGNDICLAWPSAEVAVMGARGAVQILHRRADPSQLVELEDSYSETFLTPWIAAERGFVDAVIDPAETRRIVNEAIALLASRRELLRGRRHDTGPL
jgi:acetyl-CoA carboxylase carboxyltransferase component